MAPIRAFPRTTHKSLSPCRLKDFDLEAPIAAQIKGFDKQARLKHLTRDKLIMHADRFSLFAAAAADEAIRSSGLETLVTNPFRVACIIGSAVGGIMNYEIGYRISSSSSMRPAIR